MKSHWKRVKKCALSDSENPVIQNRENKCFIQENVG